MSENKRIGLNEITHYDTKIKEYTEELLEGKSDVGHTHNYAGSSSSGGAAKSAVADSTGADIASQFANVKNDIALNRTTLGTQCKNLLKLSHAPGHTYTNSSKTVTWTFNQDYSISMIVTTALTSGQSYEHSKVNLQPGVYIYSVEGYSTPNITHTQLYYRNADGSWTWLANFSAIENKIIVTEETTYSFRAYRNSAVTVGVTETFYPMLRYADIMDDTYEPYAEDINTRINNIIANYLPTSGGTISGNLTVNGTVTATEFVGNASSASKLETARNINGMSIDGSANRVNYGTCSTAAATAAKVVACTGFALVTGAEITVKFTVTNTASSPTLNVNSTGAKAIYYRGSAISAGYLAANRTYTFRYNGTQYELVGDVNTNTDTLVTQDATTTTNFRPLLLGYTSSTDPSALDAVVTNTVYKSSTIYAQPSTGTLFATRLTASDSIKTAKSGALLLYTATTSSPISGTIENIANYTCVMVNATIHANSGNTNALGYFQFMLPVQRIISNSGYNFNFCINLNDGAIVNGNIAATIDGDTLTLKQQAPGAGYISQIEVINLI